ncbi:HK97 family phage prohead protease [Mycobacteroides abscessus subsp. abscessus]|uniref:phage major capsid protein n=1 Tax=Mycobacteroides abscessus TaxID=36809 RepID=UPI0009282F12|nr:phage major capsid protein [Mycobacteroides abscessus]SHP85347.1 HK97 family phage prohead protease [Mycobacteroides abscessus subsp. abscessus]
MRDKEALLTDRVAAFEARAAITDRVTDEGRDALTGAETAEFRSLSARIEHLDEQLDERERSGRDNPEAAAVARAQSRVHPDRDLGTGWASRAATAVLAMGGTEGRNVVSGSIDIPELIEIEITPKARPQRLIDLLATRKPLSENSFEYLRQTVRTNNAAPVPDGALKPTSILTATPITDRARVIAHLSEPVVIRLLEDHRELERWLHSEMEEGVLDALEQQVISGNGSGENMVGLLTVAGTTPVPFATDKTTTLRKARTALQLLGERPNAVVLNPLDAEDVDLTRWGASGGFLLDGFADTNASSGNVFGGNQIQRVISPSVPAGTAIVGDWEQLRLYVREAVRLQIDTAGELFTHNQVVFRAEGRYGLGILRPSAFAVVDLVA